MLQKLRTRQGGFTLIELLIVVAIIGIIAALLIPNFLDAIQKGKQKRTQGDMRGTGTAMMSWLTDQVSAGAAGQGTADWSTGLYTDAHESTHEEVAKLLTPRYIQIVPERDGWDNLYEMWLKTFPFNTENYMYVRSPGRDGEYSAASYVTGPFEPTDYAQDIVWADGYFIRWPQKVQIEEAGGGG